MAHRRNAPMISTYLPPSVMPRLDAAAHEHSTSRSGLIRLAIARFLDGPDAVPPPIVRDRRPGPKPGSRSKRVTPA
jgi:hypothetical protein